MLIQGLTLLAHIEAIDNQWLIVVRPECHPELAEVRVRDGVGECFNERSGGVFSFPNEGKCRSPLAA